MSYFQRTCLMLFCLCSSANAQVVQPPNLKRGDEYHFVFITSGTRDSAATNIEDYNDWIQAAADESPLIGDWGLTWFAIGATQSTNVSENIPTDLFGIDVPSNYFVTGELLKTNEPWDITELGTMLPNAPGLDIDVMAGFDWEGNTSSFPLGSSRGVTGGFYTSGFPFWFYDGGRIPAVGNDNQLPMYAISERLIAVPEPSAIVLALASLGLLGALRRRVR